MDEVNETHGIPPACEAKDYSDRDNWMVFTDAPDMDVDLFYLYPTSASNECKTPVSEVDDAMRRQAERNYLKSASAMAGYTNVYAPYYRQLSAVSIMQAGSAKVLAEMCGQGVTCVDVFAALDYFFENLNDGRPYILASHSQGSAHMGLVLSQYMTAHLDQFERMVACYAIGWNFPDSWFEANPHVKKATGETDTGVLITWNTEKPGCTGSNLVLDMPDGEAGFLINPLNWKTDETPAPLSFNKGSMELGDDNSIKIVPGKADAKINLARGVIECSTNDAEVMPPHPLFGDGSFHFDDWAFYYENAKENGKKRIDAFLGK